MDAEGTPRPTPIPAPDRYQIERLNTLYDLTAPVTERGWRARLVGPLRRFLVRILFRQQEFNAAVVDHLNRNVTLAAQAHEASVRTLHLVEETMGPSLGRVDAAADELRRYQQAHPKAWQRLRGAIETAVGHEVEGGSLALAQRRFRGHSLVTGFVLMPLVVPYVVLGVSLLILFSKGTIGVHPGLVAVILGHGVITLPYTILLLLPRLRLRLQRAVAERRRAQRALRRDGPLDPGRRLGAGQVRLLPPRLRVGHLGPRRRQQPALARSWLVSTLVA